MRITLTKENKINVSYMLNGFCYHKDYEITEKFIDKNAIKAIFREEMKAPTKNNIIYN